MTTHTVPFEGNPPQVRAGQTVECRTASGAWITMVATGPARYDLRNAVGRQCWLSVPVVPPDWAKLGERAPWVNWPAEDVRVPS